MVDNLRINSFKLNWNSHPFDLALNAWLWNVKSSSHIRYLLELSSHPKTSMTRPPWFTARVQHKLNIIVSVIHCYHSQRLAHFYCKRFINFTHKRYSLNLFNEGRLVSSCITVILESSVMGRKSLGVNGVRSKCK